jgi:hypothetical protein
MPYDTVVASEKHLWEDLSQWEEVLTRLSEDPQFENVGSEPAAVHGAGAKLAEPEPCQ